MACAGMTVSSITPSELLNGYARASDDLGGGTIWVDALYGRAASDSKFSPDCLIPPLTISASNPFLSTTIRDQLVAAGETSFTMGRVFNDVYEMSFDSVREAQE